MATIVPSLWCAFCSKEKSSAQREPSVDDANSQPYKSINQSTATMVDLMYSDFHAIVT